MARDRAHIADVAIALPRPPVWRSLAAAAAIMTAWLTIHVGMIFFWPLAFATAPLAVALVLLQAWLSTGLFIVAHDAMHGSFAAGRPRLNHAAGRLALSLYACLSFDRLRAAHFRHHAHAGLDGDPDFNARDPRAFWPWLARFFAGYYTHTQIARIVGVAILYMIVGGAHLANIALFWAVPAFLALFQLFYFGTYLPHRHADDAFADRHRARSNAMGPVAALVSCFNFGAYHHEHHLHPDTPWWALPGRRSRPIAYSAR